MREHQIRPPPVLDLEGRLVGVLSMETSSHGREGHQKEVAPEEVTDLIADVCSPDGREVDLRGKEH